MGSARSSHRIAAGRRAAADLTVVGCSFSGIPDAIGDAHAERPPSGKDGPCSEVGNRGFATHRQRNVTIAATIAPVPPPVPSGEVICIPTQAAIYSRGSSSSPRKKPFLQLDCGRREGRALSCSLHIIDPGRTSYGYDHAAGW